MTDTQILFKRMRNFIKHWKCPELLEYVKKKYPDRDMHNLAGSMGQLKLTDLFIVTLSRVQHQKADSNRDEAFVQYLPESANLIQEFITHLLKQIQEKENGTTIQSR